jgi:type I protein arginine methyltransferase
MSAKKSLSSNSNSTHSSETNDDEGWQDAEDDVEGIECVSLCDEVAFPSIHDMLRYCEENHSFDFRKLVQDLGVYVSSRVRRFRVD